MKFDVQAVLEKIAGSQYTGERSALYHLINGIEIEVSLLSTAKLPLHKVLDGPPHKCTAESIEQLNPMFKECWMVVPEGSTTGALEFCEDKWQWALEEYREINTKFYGLLFKSILTNCVHKKHLIADATKFDGLGLWNILKSEAGKIETRILEIMEDIDSLKLETLSYTSWNSFLASITSLRDELNGLPGIRNEDKLSKQKFLMKFGMKIADFFPSLSTALDLETPGLDFNKLLRLVDAQLKRASKKSAQNNVSAMYVSGQKGSQHYGDRYSPYKGSKGEKGYKGKSG